MSWNIGVSTGAWVGEDICAALGPIEEAGFSAIEVGTPPGHFDPWNLDQIRSLSQRMIDSGLQPVSIHAPFGGLLDLSDPNPQHRNAAVGAILVAASALRALGGNVVVVHVTDVPRDGENVRQRMADCASALSVLTRSCEQMHMTLAIENPLPHLIGGRPDELGWVFEHVGESARACLDTSHATLGGQLEGVLDAMGDRLVHVHANDHRGTTDEHLAPGDGIVPWPRIGEHLRKIGFLGWIMLELNREVSSSHTRLACARDELVSRLG